jgi:hypothetical protein
MNEQLPKDQKITYPGQGHPWADFLHHRARAIDWLYAGEGSGHCKGDDAAIAKTLSMDPVQVTLIRTRDRSFLG